MRLMLSYLKRYKGLVFLNFISVFGFALTELGIPTIISRMVDGGVASGDREYLLKMGGLIDFGCGYSRNGCPRLLRCQNFYSGHLRYQK